MNLGTLHMKVRYTIDPKIYCDILWLQCFLFVTRVFLCIIDSDKTCFTHLSMKGAGHMMHKSEMTEEDISVITSYPLFRQRDGWATSPWITKITAGWVHLLGNLVVLETPKNVGYLV